MHIRKYLHLVSGIIRLMLFFALFILLPVSGVLSQDDSTGIEGIEIIVSKKEKTKHSYIFLTGGYQAPAWIGVPMTPENSPELKKKSSMEVQAPGWFAGLGIIKKTESRFEAGLLANFYKNTVPVAFSGQRSTSDWVYEQNNNTDYFTGVFEDDIHRKSEVISFRGTVRYKIPVSNIRFWGGLTAGTFSGTVTFAENNTDNPGETYRQTTVGLTFQTGIDLTIKDSLNRDLLSFTLYSDIGGPKIEEKLIGIFSQGWQYNNSGGNYAVNPIRVGFAVGFHVK